MTEPAIDPVTRDEILDLLGRRARGADRFDAALMRACHPLDATDDHGTYQGSMHGMIDALEVSNRTGPPCRSKLHVVANALLERHGETVVAETYHVAHETFVEAGGPTDTRIGGRYLDVFRHVEGRWLIQHRAIAYDWSRVDPATDPSWDPATQPDDLRGRRDAEDLLYRRCPQARGTLPDQAQTQTREDISVDAMQRLLDKQAIAEVLYRRARAGDRADAELAHTCYHPGATERHGVFDGEAADFIDRVSFTRPREGSPIKGMFHIVTNILIDFKTDDEAFVEAYHVAWCQMSDATDATIGGRYLDTFKRIGGKWAIAHRDVIFDFSRVEPETAKFWDKHPAKPFLYGKRGADDPLYAYAARGA